MKETRKGIDMKGSVLTVWLLAFLILGGCGVWSTDGEKTAPQQIFTPHATSPSTFSPANTATTIAALKTTPIPTNTQVVDMITPVHTFPVDRGHRSAILFRKGFEHNWSGGIFFPDTGETLDLDAGLFPFDWSPNGQSLLVADDQGNRLVGDCLGRNFKKVDQPDQNSWFSVFWLTNESLVATTHLPGEFGYGQITYLININGNKSTKMGPDFYEVVETSPDGQFWFMSGYNDLLLLRPDGSVNPISIPFSISDHGPQRKPYFAFMPDSQSFFFIKVSLSEPEKLRVMYAAIMDHVIQPAVEFYDGIDMGNAIYSVSPDGRYLAIVIDENDLFLLNIQTRTIDYHWDWPNKKQYPPEFAWSPDSKHIALTQSVSQGVQDDLVMVDIHTGQVQPVLPKEDPEAHYEIVDWKVITCK